MAWKCPKCGRTFRRQEQDHYCVKPQSMDEDIAAQDEALKDADVIHHCMNDLSKPVKDKERARFGALCAEFGMEGA